MSQHRLGLIERQIAVAIIYAVAYSLLRKFGFAHFVPLAGFKLSVLLLTPRRYWPALFISEAGMLAYGLWGCIAQFGWAFYLFSIVPPIGLLMAVVGFCRWRFHGLSLPDFRISSLLICVIASSAVLVADGLISASLISHAEDVGRKPLLELLPDYFLGVYAGLLAITPAALIGAAEWHKRLSLKAIWARNKTLLQASVVTTLAVVVGVVALLQTHNTMARFVGQAALFLPAGYFSIKWGWKGSAVMGGIASFAIILLMPAMFDIPTLMAQTMLALFLTTFIVLGLQTTKLKHALRTTENNLGKARFEHRLAEAKLQRSSFELSFANTELTRLHRHLLIQLDSTHNSGCVEEYKQALAKNTAKLNELAYALAPPMGASHPLALDEDGPIAHLLKKLQIAYQPDLYGQLSLLSGGALSMLYRLACESVGHLLEQCPTDHVVLTTRTENTQEMLTVRLTVLSNGNPIAIPNQDIVAKSLGTFGLRIEELRARTQLFNGNAFTTHGCIQLMIQQELTAQR